MKQSFNHSPTATVNEQNQNNKEINIKPIKQSKASNVKRIETKIQSKTIFFKFDGGRPGPQLIALNFFLQIGILRTLSTGYPVIFKGYISCRSESSNKSLVVLDDDEKFNEASYFCPHFYSSKQSML